MLTLAFQASKIKQKCVFRANSQVKQKRRKVLLGSVPALVRLQCKRLKSVRGLVPGVVARVSLRSN